MNRTQQVLAVIAICASIILAGSIIAYNPGDQEDEFDFRFPGGFTPSMGTQSYVQQGELPPEKTISLSGSGSSSAKADLSKVILGVITEDSDASDATSENAELMNSVIEAILGQGITEEDIKTVTYSVNPRYDWETRQTTGYVVTNLIQIEIQDLDIVGAVIDSATEAGANSVQGVTFNLSDGKAQELKMEAYQAALEDARSKADVIANTLGLEITGVHSVTESSYSPITPFRGFEAADSSAKTPIIEGDLSVTVNIHIVYTFQDM
jgi:hypothetical protein